MIGFIGLGNMGSPMARRLIQSGLDVVAYDTRNSALERIVSYGAHAATSPREVADRTETVLASLPSPDAVLGVATGAGGVIEGFEKAAGVTVGRRADNVDTTGE